MRVRVRRVDDQSEVVVRGQAGSVRAIWIDDQVPDDGEFEVELDVPDVIDWKDIEVDEVGRPSLRMLGDHVGVSGVLEDLDELGVMTLRLPDGTIMVETAGDAPSAVHGKCVQFVTERLHAYPVSY